MKTITHIVALAVAMSASAIVGSATAIRPPDGLVGWWREKATSTTVVNAYPYANNGTVSSVDSTTGKVGNGFSFDTDGDDIVINGDSSLNLTSFTISTWLKATDNLNCPVVEWAVMDGSTETSGCGVHLWVGTTNGEGDAGEIHVNIVDKEGTYHWFSTTDTPIANNTWYLVSLTFNHSDKNAKLYVNGVEKTAIENDDPNDGDLPPFGGTWDPATGSRLHIGHRFSESGCGNTSPYGDSFKGILDEVMIFNRALSACEIQTIYDAGSDGMVAPTGKAVVENPLWSGTTFSFDVVAPSGNNIQVYSSTDGVSWTTYGGSHTVGSSCVYHETQTTTGIANKYFKAVNTSSGGGCANYAVGFASRTKPSDKRYMLAANHFDRGCNTLAEHIPSTAVGTVVSVFSDPNSSSSTSRTFTSGSPNYWSPTTAVSLAPGTPFMVDKSGTAVTVAVWGYLPDGSRTIQLPAASSRARGSWSPKSGTISTLGITPTENDSISLYDVTSQAYKTGSYIDAAWEGDYVTEPSVQLLEGFFFYASPARNWIQSLDICQ